MRMQWLHSLVLQDWHKRLSVVLVGVFLLQFVLWVGKEDRLWLPETITIVKLVLLWTCLIELVPKIPLAIRLLLQVSALFYVLSSVLGFERIPVEVNSWDNAVAWMELHVMQFSPFLWFALGAWLICLVTIWWVQAKWRVFVLIIMSVTFFGIKDSFSVVMLWQQAAMAIFCGLLLLIIRHFADLKKKNPAGWSHLADNPASIALPVVFFVSLVVFLGTLAPDVRAVLTDPYTVWKNMRGEPVDLFNSGFGNTSLAGGDATSGYSRSDSTLGGGFEFDYTPVFSVNTSHRSYWRGETRSLYTGKGWIKSDTERRTPVSGVAPEAPLAADPRLNVSKLKTVEVTQTVTLLQPEEKYPVLFGAYSVDRLQSTMTAGNANGSFAPIRWSSRLGELRWDEASNQPYPTTYSIVSKVPVVDEAELRKAVFEPGVRTGLDEYLYLPESVPQRVKDLAADVTKSALTPYDKVKQLEQYLNKTFTYTNTPDLSRGRSRDFVDRFLFEIKEGYCDYYSTAMVVMTRTLGIPARWVKGYSQGVNVLEQDNLGMMEMLADSDGSGEYTVRNSDAHSWAEVYFQGFGWIPFEPTAGFAFPTVTEPTQVESLPVPEADTTESATATDNESGFPVKAIGWGAGAVAASILATWIIGRRRQVDWTSLFQPNRRVKDWNERAVLEYEKLLRYARRKGYSRSDHETAREMTDRWITKDKWLKNDLEFLLALFEKAKYSGAPVTEQEVTDMTRLVQKLREQM